MLSFRKEADSWLQYMRQRKYFGDKAGNMRQLCMLMRKDISLARPEPDVVYYLIHTHTHTHFAVKSILISITSCISSDLFIEYQMNYWSGCFHYQA